MLEIIEKYNEQERNYKFNCDRLEKKIAERNAQIARLEKRLHNLPRLNWLKGIVEPVAIALAERTGLHWEIYGPFGLRAETSIYLREDMSRSICDQTTRSITLTPYHDENGDWCIRYDTGETDERCPKNSIGHLNNVNCVTSPLPDTIEEIERLLVMVEREPKEETRNA